MSLVLRLFRNGSNDGAESWQATSPPIIQEPKHLAKKRRKHESADADNEQCSLDDRIQEEIFQITASDVSKSYNRPLTEEATACDSGLFQCSNLSSFISQQDSATSNARISARIAAKGRMSWKSPGRRKTPASESRSGCNAEGANSQTEASLSEKILPENSNPITGTQKVQKNLHNNNHCKTSISTSSVDSLTHWSIGSNYCRDENGELLQSSAEVSKPLDKTGKRQPLMVKLPKFCTVPASFVRKKIRTVSTAPTPEPDLSGLKSSVDSDANEFAVRQTISDTSANLLQPANICNGPSKTRLLLKVFRKNSRFKCAGVTPVKVVRRKRIKNDSAQHANDGQEPCTTENTSEKTCNFLNGIPPISAIPGTKPSNRQLTPAKVIKKRRLAPKKFFNKLPQNGTGVDRPLGLNDELHKNLSSSESNVVSTKAVRIRAANDSTVLDTHIPGLSVEESSSRTSDSKQAKLLICYNSNGFQQLAKTVTPKRRKKRAKMLSPSDVLCSIRSTDENLREEKLPKEAAAGVKRQLQCKIASKNSQLIAGIIQQKTPRRRIKLFHKSDVDDGTHATLSSPVGNFQNLNGDCPACPPSVLPQITSGFTKPQRSKSLGGPVQHSTPKTLKPKRQRKLANSTGDSTTARQTFRRRINVTGSRSSRKRKRPTYSLADNDASLPCPQPDAGYLRDATMAQCETSKDVQVGSRLEWPSDFDGYDILNGAVLVTESEADGQHVLDRDVLMSASCSFEPDELEDPIQHAELLPVRVSPGSSNVTEVDNSMLLGALENQISVNPPPAGEDSFGEWSTSCDLTSAVLDGEPLVAEFQSTSNLSHNISCTAELVEPSVKQLPSVSAKPCSSLPENHSFSDTLDSLTEWSLEPGNDSCRILSSDELLNGLDSSICSLTDFVDPKALFDMSSLPDAVVLPCNSQTLIGATEQDSSGYHGENDSTSPVSDRTAAVSSGCIVLSRSLVAVTAVVDPSISDMLQSAINEAKLMDPNESFLSEQSELLVDQLQQILMANNATELATDTVVPPSVAAGDAVPETEPSNLADWLKTNSDQICEILIANPADLTPEDDLALAVAPTIAVSEDGLSVQQSVVEGTTYVAEHLNENCLISMEALPEIPTTVLFMSEDHGIEGNSSVPDIESGGMVAYANLDFSCGNTGAFEISEQQMQFIPVLNTAPDSTAEFMDGSVFISSFGLSENGLPTLAQIEELPVAAMQCETSCNLSDGIVTASCGEHVETTRRHDYRYMLDEQTGELVVDYSDCILDETTGELVPRPDSDSGPEGDPSLVEDQTVTQNEFGELRSPETSDDRFLETSAETKKLSSAKKVSPCPAAVRKSARIGARRCISVGAELLSVDVETLTESESHRAEILTSDASPVISDFTPPVITEFPPVSESPPKPASLCTGDTKLIASAKRHEKSVENSASKVSPSSNRRRSSTGTSDRKNFRWNSLTLGDTRSSELDGNPVEQRQTTNSGSKRVSVITDGPSETTRALGPVDLPPLPARRSSSEKVELDKGCNRNDAENGRRHSRASTESKDRERRHSHSSHSNSIGDHDRKHRRLSSKDEADHSKSVSDRLAHLGDEIRKSLAVDKTDIDRCLCVLSSLETLSVSVTSPVLAKNPDIVLTIKKCRKYKGSECVRAKAEIIYTRFKTLFQLPGSDAVDHAEPRRKHSDSTHHHDGNSVHHHHDGNSVDHHPENRPNTSSSKNNKDHSVRSRNSSIDSAVLSTEKSLRVHVPLPPDVDHTSVPSVQPTPAQEHIKKEQKTDLIGGTLKRTTSVEEQVIVSPVGDANQQVDDRPAPVVSLPSAVVRRISRVEPVLIPLEKVDEEKPHPESPPPPAEDDIVLPFPLLLPLGPLSPLPEVYDDDPISDVVSELSSHLDLSEEQSDLDDRIDDILAEEDAEIFATSREQFHKELCDRVTSHATSHHTTVTATPKTNICDRKPTNVGSDIDDEELHELLGV